MEDNSIPPFVLKSDELYLFAELEFFPDFLERIVLSERNKEEIHLKTFMQDEKNRKILSQLLNSYIKKSCYKKYIGYSRRYKRFYFRINEESEKRTEQYRSKKGRNTNRVVAQRQSYYEDHIRHFGFQIDYVYSEEELYIALNPKYFFTSNGKDVIDDPSLVTKLTNYQTARELNQSVINQVYFIFKYLANNGQVWHISDYPNEEIQIYQSKTFKVNFGILHDFDGDPNQMTLL